jgi:hypothetical protein
MNTTLTIVFSEDFYKRLQATALREMTSIETWAAVALRDCVNASEEAVGGHVGKHECPVCLKWTRDTTAGCDHCDLEDK